MALGRVLAVIPARGGSKGVPRKNLQEVSGKPLIAFTIECALAVKHLFHSIIVSTEDDEIAAVARHWGAEVPFRRPVNLAGDESPMAPVLQHAVVSIEERDGILMDWVCLLQPTDPLRTPQDLEEAIRIADTDSCDSVISVVQVFSVHPILMKRIEDNRLVPFCVEENEGTRRQDLQPPAYMRNGAVYLSRRDVVVERGSIWGDVIRPYVMPPDRSIGIDSELDLKLVEIMMRERLARKAVG